MLLSLSLPEYLQAVRTRTFCHPLQLPFRQLPGPPSAFCPAHHAAMKCYKIPVESFKQKRSALVWARRASLLQEWEIQFQTHAVYLESCASHKSIEKQLDSRLLTMMFGFFSVKTTRILTQWTQGVYGTHHSRFPGVGPLQILSKMA